MLQGISKAGYLSLFAHLHSMENWGSFRAPREWNCTHQSDQIEVNRFYREIAKLVVRLLSLLI
ncbi:MAG: hypothetical protein CM1200mP40_25840 [Gammaproteobacteria bacterium]|nr:MAG: hypothetical protein CM1200mP40_25840 [Gammaproteobacteria bacterium]